MGSIIAVIITVTIAVALIAWNVVTKNSEERLSSAILIVFASIFLFIAVESMCSKDTPNAIDVYRGKTTLEITYRDGVALDTTVVFKNIK